MLIKDVLSLEDNVKANPNGYEYVGSFCDVLCDIVENHSSLQGILFLEGENSGKTISFTNVYYDSSYNDGYNDVELVFKVEFDGQTEFWKTSYYYLSYDGTTWERNWSQVYPKEVTEIKYYPKDML